MGNVPAEFLRATALQALDGGTFDEYRDHRPHRARVEGRILFTDSVLNVGPGVSGKSAGEGIDYRHHSVLLFIALHRSPHHRNVYGLQPFRQLER